MTLEQEHEEQTARLRNEKLKTVSLLTTIIITIAGLLTGGGIWIANQNDHMDRMEKHMDYQDQQMLLLNNKVEWLIRENPDGKEAPDGFQAPPKTGLIAPYSVAQQPQISDAPYIPQP